MNFPGTSEFLRDIFAPMEDAKIFIDTIFVEENSTFKKDITKNYISIVDSEIFLKNADKRNVLVTL